MQSISIYCLDLLEETGLRANDINMCDKGGKTALHYASGRNKLKSI